jgi:hypothetical protein
MQSQAQRHGQFFFFVLLASFVFYFIREWQGLSKGTLTLTDLNRDNWLFFCQQLNPAELLVESVAGRNSEKRCSETAGNAPKTLRHNSFVLIFLHRVV